MNINFLSILMDVFFIAMLLWCSYTDLKSRTISNISIILLLCLGLAHTIIMGLTISTWWTYPLSMLFAIPSFIAWIKNNMGAGDVKLVMVIAFYMGLLNTIIAFTLMVPVVAILIIKSWIKKKTLKYRIPIAPVLVFGAIGAVIADYLYTFIYI